jgi:hypothetical protein
VNGGRERDPMNLGGLWTAPRLAGPWKSRGKAFISKKDGLAFPPLSHRPLEKPSALPQALGKLRGHSFEATWSFPHRPQPLRRTTLCKKKEEKGDCRPAGS